MYIRFNVLPMEFLAWVQTGLIGHGSCWNAEGWVKWSLGPACWSPGIGAWKRKSVWAYMQTQDFGKYLNQLQATGNYLCMRVASISPCFLLVVNCHSDTGNHRYFFAASPKGGKKPFVDLNVCLIHSSWEPNSSQDSDSKTLPSGGALRPKNKFWLFRGSLLGPELRS